MRFRLHRRKPAIAITGMVILLLTAIVVITAVAAQNASATPTMNPKVALLPPGKQTYIAIGAARTIELATAHPEWRNIPPTDTPGTPIVGIQYKYPNAWNMHADVSNEWFGTVNGQPIAVFAGTDSTWDARGIVYDSGQGYVAVGVGKITDNNYHEYLTPTKHGGVKITAVNGTMVSLVAEDGTTFTFDLDTRTFS
ncbi:MAG: hypothetical protein ACYDAR_00940 [Thermomicrobiales bacterium]